MALVKCRECKAEVSSKAAACPKCGAPIKSVPKQYGCFSSMLLIGVALVVVVAAVNSISRRAPATGSPPPTSSARTDEVVATAQQMKAEFDRATTAKNMIATAEIAQALVQRYPESPEAKLVQPYLADLLAAASKARQEKAKADEAARIQVEKERAARRASALRGLTKHRDEMAGISFYFAPGGNLRSVGNRFGLYLAVPDKEQPYLRFKWMYHGDNWLFVEKVHVKIDSGEPVSIPYGHFTVERDNSGAGVWEWMDDSVPASTLPFLDAIAAGKRVMIRMEGNQYVKDRQLSAGERAAIARILKAYRDLQ